MLLVQLLLLRQRRLRRGALLVRLLCTLLGHSDLLLRVLLIPGRVSPLLLLLLAASCVERGPICGLQHQPAAW